MQPLSPRRKTAFEFVPLDHSEQPTREESQKVAAGGYQAGAVEVYGLPATRWTPDIEYRIAAAVARMAEKVGPAGFEPATKGL